MNDDGYDRTIPYGLQPYPADQSLYRAILYKDWLKNHNTEVRHQMFKRFRKDLSGLSVDTTPEACRNNFQEPIHGLIDITANQIREVTRRDGDHLEVIPANATHGNIKKVPYPDDDQIEATHLARQLAEKAHVYEHN